ncbi:lysine N(6)-hydroxylase/L-ornithine N(5)-oxygenase family protein [Methylocapsa palsarum]|uniref:Lysine N6-hydroxylase n=1 Tax=Methylocapsa palsarum TaxID=1612308 RepID=A0A1I3W9K1_9HYPH|nr:SidA/IucD/PvdA family monooxygenase [Methylocapsa palsarum]SFK03397.1 lysine N6-hydroxylase [Methylocapsa palsarum]
MTEHNLDLAGIGIGPFNLSLAAHLDAIPALKARFFDQRERFAWHPGFMLPDVELQTSFLKDLVTATNPTSRWSFLSYLVAHKRFYQFLNAEFEATPRKEFAKYLAWTADGLSQLQFNARVKEVSFGRTAFNVRLDDEEVSTQHLALGIGHAPYAPAWASPLIGANCFHSSQAVDRLADVSLDQVAVIGGGQSGAEVVLHLLSDARCGTKEIKWISRRQNFEPLDATPFTNELFTPDYVECFRGLGEERRQALLAHHKLASDGASASTLRAIYRRLYTLHHLEASETDVAFMPHRDVIHVDRQKDAFKLIMRNGFDGGIEIVFVKTIILATGYAFRIPDFLAPLKDRIALDRSGNFILGDDFSLKWDGPRRNQIFALNAGRNSYGIAEPQLSLMAWRSAVIVNALLQQPHFDLDLPPSIMRWATSEDRYTEALGASVSIAG